MLGLEVGARYYSIICQPLALFLLLRQAPKSKGPGFVDMFECHITIWFEPSSVQVGNVVGFNVGKGART